MRVLAQRRHTEWQYSVCDVCGFLDEEVRHDLTAPDSEPESPQWERTSRSDPNYDDEMVEDSGSRDHLFEYGMGRPGSASYDQPCYKVDGLSDKAVAGKDIFAEDVWGSTPAPEPEPVQPYAPPEPTGVRSAMQLLGFSAGASRQEMRAEFRRLLKQNHPDVSEAADATQRTIAIHDAYSLLKQRGFAD